MVLWLLYTYCTYICMPNACQLMVMYLAPSAVGTDVMDIVKPSKENVQQTLYAIFVCCRQCFYVLCMVCCLLNNVYYTKCSLDPHHTTALYTSPHQTTQYLSNLHLTTPQHYTPHHTTPHNTSAICTSPHHTTQHLTNIIFTTPHLATLQHIYHASLHHSTPHHLPLSIH